MIERTEADGASTTKTRDQRRSALARHLTLLISQGRRIESQSDYQAVLVTGHYVWESREVVSVDSWGTVAVQRLGMNMERLVIAIAVLAVILILIVIGAVLG